MSIFDTRASRSEFDCGLYAFITRSTRGYRIIQLVKSDAVQFFRLRLVNSLTSDSSADAKPSTLSRYTPGEFCLKWNATLTQSAAEPTGTSVSMTPGRAGPSPGSK